MDNQRHNSKAKVYVVLNPVAGHSSAGEIRQLLKHQFDLLGWTYEIYETTGKEDVAELIRAARGRGVELVVVAGGDGTVAGAVNGLMHTDVPLGIVPVGTGNGLARSLDIPLDPESAIALLSSEHTILQIDALQTHDQYFILNVSAGISARAMRQTPPEVKRRFGMAAYAWTIFWQAIAAPSQRFVLTVDQHTARVRATEILVSNGAVLQEPPFPLGPREGLSDGEMDVYVITARTISGYLRAGWNVLVRRKTRTDNFRILSAKHTVVINSANPRRPLPTQADGEPLGSTPVEVHLVPKALRVIVPLHDETNPISLKISSEE